MANQVTLSILEYWVKVFVLDKIQKTKFQDRATKGKLVGYSEVSKAYRVWIPSKRRVVVSRDVKFISESVMQEKNQDLSSDSLVDYRREIAIELSNPAQEKMSIFLTADLMSKTKS